jgi:hypothetical protein
MINRVALLTAPDVAMIWGLPMAAAVDNPEAVMVARVLSDEVQVTEAVTSAVLPSLKVPIAANCCVDPTATDGLVGVIWMDRSVLTELPPPPQPATAANMLAQITAQTASRLAQFMFQCLPWGFTLTLCQRGLR